MGWNQKSVWISRNHRRNENYQKPICFLLLATCARQRREYKQNIAGCANGNWVLWMESICRRVRYFWLQTRGRQEKGPMQSANQHIVKQVPSTRKMKIFEELLCWLVLHIRVNPSSNDISGFRNIVPFRWVLRTYRLSSGSHSLAELIWFSEESLRIFSNETDYIWVSFVCVENRRSEAYDNE